MDFVQCSAVQCARDEMECKWPGWNCTVRHLSGGLCVHHHVRSITVGITSLRPGRLGPVPVHVR